MNRLASLLSSDNITPQLISDLYQNKDTTPNKEERVRKINATALDAIKAYTPMGWAWSDVQVSQRRQIQTPARQTVSTRRTRYTIQRNWGADTSTQLNAQSEDQEIDNLTKQGYDGCSQEFENMGLVARPKHQRQGNLHHRHCQSPSRHSTQLEMRDLGAGCGSPEARIY